MGDNYFLLTNLLSEDEQKIKREILIFITPRVVPDAQVAQNK